MRLKNVHFVVPHSTSPVDDLLALSLDPTHQRVSFADGTSISYSHGDVDKPKVVGVSWTYDSLVSKPSDKHFNFGGVSHVVTCDVRFVPNRPVPQPSNYFGFRHSRVDTPVSTEPRPDTLLGLSHIGFKVPNLLEAKDFFLRQGFVLSDETEEKNCFLRGSELNYHHQLLLVQGDSPDVEMHHLAIGVADVYSLFTQGLGCRTSGLETAMGPGRHVISSATYWYFHTALGMLELCCDEDYLTPAWVPRVIPKEDAIVSEWVVANGCVSSSAARVKTKD